MTKVRPPSARRRAHLFLSSRRGQALVALLVLLCVAKLVPPDNLLFQTDIHKVPRHAELISCPRMEFPKRLPEQEPAFHVAWNKTHVWAKEQGLTFLELNALVFHKHKLFEIESKAVKGMILECGVAKAGSAIVFASLKHPERCLHLFDTFEGIPKPSSKDGPDVVERYEAIQIDKRNCQRGLPNCNRNYYGNMKDLLQFDQEQFALAGYPPANNSVYFHKGLFDDTVWPDGPIAYAHLDGDWYDSTYHMLERLTPHISVGGYFVLDDVYAWSGAKNAYIDFFQVDLQWLQEQPHKACWTRITDRNHQPRAFRLALEVRAVAQAMPMEFLQQQEEAAMNNNVNDKESTVSSISSSTLPACMPPNHS